MRVRRKFLVHVVSLICVALALAACGENLPATTLDPRGNHAQRIYELLVPLLWAALAVFVVVEGLLVYAVVRFRRRPDSGIPAQIHGNTRLEIMWTIGPALIVLVIAVLTIRTQAEQAVQPSNALQIRVIGHQWWWEFHYPGLGPDGQPLVTANDLYIPVGRDVTLLLEGQDVIHSFWVPKLAGKTDALPREIGAVPGEGKTNRLSFRAEEEGIFRGLCAEFCGEQHAVMRFRTVAVAPDVFDNWVEQQRTAPPEPQGDILRGQQAFLAPENGCIGCHAIAGTTAQGILGPNLTYFGSRETIAAGALPNTPENLRRWLFDPNEVKPGNLMSTQITRGKLSDQTINDLVAYLQSMKLDIPKPAAK
jgi:cytochrome c oxidase subunit II